jgi:hypothetical protein
MSGVVPHIPESHLQPPGTGHNPEIAFAAGMSLRAVQFR